MFDLGSVGKAIGSVNSDFRGVQASIVAHGIYPMTMRESFMLRPGIHSQLKITGMGFVSSILSKLTMRIQTRH